jgi:hypothetical protein
MLEARQIEISPSLTIKYDDVGQGRLLPSTSVDQYAATLGKWFGMSDSDLLTVLPNLVHWNASERNLGFV